MGVRRIGVDIGGTAIKAGCVQDGVVLGRGEVETPLEFEACVAAVEKLVRSVGSIALGEAVGVGLPGVVDPVSSEVLDAPNLEFLVRQPVAAALSERLGTPVRIENDANVAALGEARHGAGRQHRDFLLATVGTGIGGGLILDGRLFRGPGGMAGEFGHISVGGDRLCGCGARGCLEASLSARSLPEWARDEGIKAATLPDLSDLARRGDKTARGLFRRAGGLLGEAFAQVALLLDLRVFLVGGGGAPVLDLLRPAALQTLATRAFGRSASDFVVEEATLGNDAGLIGATELGAGSLPAHGAAQRT